MAGFEYTVEEMKVMPTVAFLNEIVLGWGFCLDLGGHMAFALIPSLRDRDEILRGTLCHFFKNNANIYLFQHDNATSHTARDIVNFLSANNIANNIAFINDWPTKSPDMNPI